MWDIYKYTQHSCILKWEMFVLAPFKLYLYKLKSSVTHYCMGIAYSADMRRPIVLLKKWQY